MDRNVQSARTNKIARLNDQFRAMADDLIVTQGVMHGVYDIVGLLKAVAGFNDFNEDNDPHGEHDFGAIRWHGDTIYWKIDYYALEHQFYCDPLSPRCQRVMTIMLASEY